MPIEHSHGKARPTLPRSSDLAMVTTAPRTDGEPIRYRDEHGRFMSGNPYAIGRGATAAVRRLLGRSGVAISDADARTVARDADRLFAETMKELPSDGPTARQLAALYCRHAALAGFWTAKASVAGLGTAEGIAAQEHASKHGQRAERLSVTMLDVATRLAKARPLTAADEPWFEVVDSEGATS